MQIDTIHVNWKSVLNRKLHFVCLELSKFGGGGLKNIDDLIINKKINWKITLQFLV